MVLSLLGVVYDISSGREFFGPSGPYRIYTGHDATFALATMSMRSTDLDVFDYVLDGVERESLADWFRYFDVKYRRAGHCIDIKHPIDMAALPAGKDPTKFIQASHSHPCRNSKIDASNSPTAAAFRAATADASTPAPQLCDTATDQEPHSLSQKLIEATKSLHEKSMRSSLMRSMRRRDITRLQYASWLHALGQVYALLEGKLDAALSCDSPLHPVLHLVDNVRLRRLPAIREDLVVLLGRQATDANWQSLSPSAGRYASRVQDIADTPHLLAVHLWVRYATALAGAQFLRTTLSQSFGLKGLEGRCPGLKYHDFGTVEETMQELHCLNRGIDAIAVEGHIDLRDAEAMLDEARLAFELDLELTDEFDRSLRRRSKF
jgi:heme oxygenase